MTLKLESKVDDAGSIDVTYFNTGASQLGLLHSQVLLCQGDSRKCNRVRRS